MRVLPMHTEIPHSFPMASLVFGTSPNRKPFSSILQLVASTSNSSLVATDFKSMEDLPDSAFQLYTDPTRSLLSPNSFIPSSHSPTTLSPSISEELHDSISMIPLNPHSDKAKSSQKNARPFKGAVWDSITPGEHHRRSLSSACLLTATGSGRLTPSPEKSFGRRLSQTDARNFYSSQLPPVDEASAAFQCFDNAPHNSSHSDTETTKIVPNSSPAKHAVAGNETFTVGGAVDFLVRRKSLDMSLGASDAGIKRLKRSQSMWTTSSSHANEKLARSNLPPSVPKFRKDAHMSEKQRMLTVKRARKVAQVFGREVPPNLIQGQDPDDENRPESSQGSMVDAILQSSSNVLTRHRSDSASSSITDTRSRPSFEKPFDRLNGQLSTPSLDNSSDNQDPISQSSLPLSSTFSERRRRAAKLSRFFGVNYQDISTSLNNVEATPVAPPELDTYELPSVEVDVQVAGRRFWGFTDNRGQMKTAEMVDVIDKLRDLKAA